MPIVYVKNNIFHKKSQYKIFHVLLGCHFDVALEKWAPVALKTFYRYAVSINRD